MAQCSISEASHPAFRFSVIISVRVEYGTRNGVGNAGHNVKMMENRE